MRREHGSDACICTPKMPRKLDGGPGRFTFHIADSAAGPWSPHTAEMDYPCFANNLTPSPVFHPNGTMFIVLHCENPFDGDLAMVSATTWRGPFKRVASAAGGRIYRWQQPHAGFPEDPFIWIRTSAVSGEHSWHIVEHNSPRGVHLYSRDGLDFTLQQRLVNGHPVAPFFYNETIAIIDDETGGGGSSTVETGSGARGSPPLVALRRERPVLIFSSTWGTAGAPIALVTSMEGGRTGAAECAHEAHGNCSWTSVQLVNAAAVAPGQSGGSFWNEST
eukprot:COSAG06_NODE_1689_length_8706_cov_7.834669_10_plen_277_part_00